MIECPWVPSMTLQKFFNKKGQKALLLNNSIPADHPFSALLPAEDEPSPTPPTLSPLSRRAGTRVWGRKATGRAGLSRTWTPAPPSLPGLHPRWRVLTWDFRLEPRTAVLSGGKWPLHRSPGSFRLRSNTYELTISVKNPTKQACSHESAKILSSFTTE